MKSRSLVVGTMFIAGIILNSGCSNTAGGTDVVMESVSVAESDNAGDIDTVSQEDIRQDTEIPYKQNLVLGDGVNVGISDGGIEACMHVETGCFNEPAGGVLTLTPMGIEDLKKVTAIDLTGWDYRDLGALPMEHLPGLRYIKLDYERGAEVNDLNVFRDNKTIESIDLDGCKASNYDALSTISSLATLRVTFDNTEDVSALEGCKNLKYLYARCPDGSDLGFLNGMDTINGEYIYLWCDHPDLHSLSSIERDTRITLETEEEYYHVVLDDISEKVSGLIRGYEWEAVSEDGFIADGAEDIEEIGKWKVYPVSRYKEIPNIWSE